jgi:hypothetical protein
MDCHCAVADDMERRVAEARAAGDYARALATPPSADAAAYIRDRVAAETREVVHGCPPDGSGLTTCCGRTPFELPRVDRMSTDPAAVTCTPPAGGAPQPKEA